MVIGYRLSVIGYRLSVIGYRLSGSSLTSNNTRIEFIAPLGMQEFLTGRFLCAEIQEAD